MNVLKITQLTITSGYLDFLLLDIYQKFWQQKKREKKRNKIKKNSRYNRQKYDQYSHATWKHIEYLSSQEK